MVDGPTTQDNRAAPVNGDTATLVAERTGSTMNTSGAAINRETAFRQAARGADQTDALENDIDSTYTEPADGVTEAAPAPQQTQATNQAFTDDQQTSAATNSNIAEGAVRAVGTFATDLSSLAINGDGADLLRQGAQAARAGSAGLNGAVRAAGKIANAAVEAERLSGAGVVALETAKAAAEATKQAAEAAKIAQAAEAARVAAEAAKAADVARLAAEAVKAADAAKLTADAAKVANTAAEAARLPTSAFAKGSAQVSGMAGTFSNSGVGKFINFIGKYAPVIVGVADGISDYIADTNEKRKLYTGLGSGIGAGVGCWAGLAAGTAAGGTVGAWIGGAVGSIIPVAGTAVGAVAGFAVGVGVSYLFTEIGRRVGRAGMQSYYANRHPEDRASTGPQALAARTDGAPPEGNRAELGRGSAGTSRQQVEEASEVQIPTPTQINRTHQRMWVVGEEIYLPIMKKHYPELSPEECKQRALSEPTDDPSAATQEAIRMMRIKFGLPQEGGVDVDFRQRLAAGDASLRLTSDVQQRPARADRSEDFEPEVVKQVPIRKTLSNVNEQALLNAVGNVQQLLQSHLSPEPALIKFAESYGPAGMKALDERLKQDGRSVIEQMARQHDILELSIAKCAMQLYGERYRKEDIIEAVQLYRGLGGHVSEHDRKKMQTQMQENHGFYGSMTATADAFTDLLGHEWADKFNKFTKQHPTQAQDKYAYFRFVLGTHKEVLSQEQLYAYKLGGSVRVED